MLPVINDAQPHEFVFFDLVNTFDAFKSTTSMVDILQMNVSTMNDLQFTTWLSAFGGNGLPNQETSLQNINSVTVDTVYAASIAEQSSVISGQFIQVLVNRLSVPLKSIGREKTVPTTYILSMKEAFIGLYIAWYTIISNRVIKISSVTVYSAYFPAMTVNALSDKAHTLLETIESNIYDSFEPSMSPTIWFDLACSVVNNTSIDVYNKQLFCSCMKPFLTFKYITCFVATDDLNQAVDIRNIKTRRLAILSIYMFIFHTVFSAYKYSTTVEAFGDDANSLAAILDNVTNLFDSEKRAIDITNQLEILNSEAHSLVQISKKIKDASAEINLTFANEGTIKKIDENFRNQMRLSTQWKLFWYVAFILTVILHCVLVTIGGKMFIYAIGLSSAWLLILSIVVLFRIYS